MTAKEYFESQAFFNKNLKEMAESDQEHIIVMLAEYAAIRLEAFWEAIGLHQLSENKNNDKF